MFSILEGNTTLLKMCQRRFLNCCNKTNVVGTASQAQRATESWAEIQNQTRNSKGLGVGWRPDSGAQRHSLRPSPIRATSQFLLFTFTLLFPTTVIPCHIIQAPGARELLFCIFLSPILSSTVFAQSRLCNKHLLNQ